MKERKQGFVAGGEIPMQPSCDSPGEFADPTGRYLDDLRVVADPDRGYCAVCGGSKVVVIDDETKPCYGCVVADGTEEEQDSGRE